MHYFSQSSIFCVHPSAAAGLRQDFVNDKNGEILLCVTLPCIKEIRSAGASGEPTVSEGALFTCAHFTRDFVFFVEDIAVKRARSARGQIRTNAQICARKTEISKISVSFVRYGSARPRDALGAFVAQRVSRRTPRELAPAGLPGRIRADVSYGKPEIGCGRPAVCCGRQPSSLREAKHSAHYGRVNVGCLMGD